MNPNQNQPNEVNSTNPLTPSPPPPQPSNPWQPQTVVGRAEITELPPVQPSYNGLSSVPPPRKSRKKLWIGLAGAVIVALIVAGTVFGYYLPNKPENVYNTGLERSGQVIDKLIDQSTEKSKLEEIKTGEIDGSLDFSYEKTSFSGTFNAKLDSTKSDSRLDVKLKQDGQPEQSLGLKFLSDLKKGNRFADIYFQLTGLKTLGADVFAPGVSDYEGKWISVEADFLESLSDGFIPPAEQKNKENVSPEEIAQLVRTVSDVSNEYVFTSDKNKAVLENREYLGKETTAEGIKAHHYKVGINNEHVRNYCKALVEKVLAEPAVKKIADMDDKEIEDSKKSAIKDCDDPSNDMKPEETFEMWVDAKYKVIHKFRVYEDHKKKDAYTDFGQIYTGGDKLALFTLYHRDENNMNVKFTLDVDINTNNSKAELTAGQEGEDSFTGKASLSAKPYSGEVKVEKPAGAIPIKDILARFGFDPTYLSGVEKDRSAENAKYQRCAEAREERANNNGQTLIPAECENL